MNRRDLLVVGSSALAASVTAQLVACADKVEKKAPSAGSGAAAGSGAVDPHAGHAGHGASAAVASATMAIAHCELAGDACLAHCLDLLGQGDTSMVDCARAVRDMLAACAAARVLVGAGSKHAAAAAALCSAACKDCKAACEPHAAKHATCKACADACDVAVAKVAAL
jgi:Cys-rich four helix bundle protein (predicted Tat secretion target)